MRTLVKATLLTAVIAWGSASPALAATLTIVDTFGGSETTWTLFVEDNCQTSCDVTLSAFFEDPDGASSGVNAYTGVFLDSFQWVVTDPNTDISAVTNPLAGSSGFGNWATDFGQVVNAGGCTNTGNDAFTCTEWTGAGEGLQIANDTTYNWSWTVDFDEEMLALAGNIRASFDTSTAKNFNIFSPGGGTFSTSTPTTPSTPETATPSTPSTSEQVAEPTLLTLLGGGLVMASRRFRRKKA